MNIEHVAILYLEKIHNKKKSSTKQKKYTFFLNGIILSLQIRTQTSPQTPLNIYIFRQ